MNFRKLLTYLTVGTAAIIPFAGAQNPTILQGSYISNVFGQSNFILNPNAQTNVANVTTVTATVTRSTTTPLVATSEFNVAIGTANGTATWATRTFDAGMKGQNCEARFSYRGFQATSKVHIKQNSNTVATLNLTPATDPRIASINFPCGDLSTATTFVVTDTAILAGTNEISGIYTGLATNMANVAQAEFVGGGEWNAVVFTRSSAAIQSTFAAFTSGSAGTAVGKATSAGTDTTVTFPFLPAGQYYVNSNLYAYAYNISNAYVNCEFSLQEIDSNIYSGLVTTGAFPTTGGIYPAGNQLQGNFTFTTSGQRRFRLVSRNIGANGATSTCNTIGDAAVKSGIYVYRFPTSSELVVTPERQNTFAGLKGAGSVNTNSVTSNSWTKLTQASGTLTRTTFGKAKVETNNDYSITIENMPVGNYYISTTGVFIAQAAAAGDSTACFFGIADSATGGAQIASMQVNANGDSSITTQASTGSTFGGVYNNTSVSNRTFFVQGYRAQGSGSCYGYSESNRPLTISVIPLDQPSNSALFVEGPVRGSNTNTAIPTNSIGGKIIDASLAKTTTSLGTWQVASGNFGTPPAGSYLMIMNSVGTQTAGLTGTGSIINESGSSVTPVVCQLNSVNGSAVDSVYGRVCYYTTDGTKTLYAWAQATGANTTVTTGLILVRLN